MNEVFELSPPADSSGLLTIVGIMTLMIGLTLLFAYILWGARHSSCEISGEALIIHTPLYGRAIPLREIEIERATSGRLSSDAPHAPSMRLNGIGLPDFKSGWFRSNGGEKLLAVVTNRDSVVSIPTRQGYRLLLSVAAPERFLQALRTAVPR
jgi:hypothetical protein